MKIIGTVSLGVIATFVFLQPAHGRGSGHGSFGGGHFSALHFSGGYSRGYSGGYSRGYGGGRSGYYAPGARYYSSGAAYRNRGYARSAQRSGNRPTTYNAGYYSLSGPRSNASRTAAFRNRNLAPANLSSTRTAGNRTQGFTSGRIVGRQGGNWHRNWDRSHDHNWNGHRCHWHNNSWIIYDPWPYWWGFGYYPYYPYNSYYDDGYSYDQSYPSDQYSQEQQPTETVYDSSRVTQVQSALSREGYYSGAIDGRLNANTRAALRNYQRDRHLAVTGNIDRGILEGLRLH
jgi:hypothetical protein